MPMPTIDTATNCSFYCQEPVFDVRPIIDDAVNEIANKYPDMFKESQRCRPPHCNIDVCRDDLFQSEYISKRNITTAKELVAAIEATNRELGEEFAKKKTGKKDKALDKAIAYDFYLGLDKVWVHRNVEE